MKFPSVHIFLLNNFAAELSSLLADVIKTYSVVKFGEVSGDNVLKFPRISKSHKTAGRIAHQSLEATISNVPIIPSISNVLSILIL